jgi:type IV pilus assembly protein PilX
MRLNHHKRNVVVAGIGNKSQRGSALVTGLIFLVVIIMLGLSASSSSIQQEMGVRNIRDQAVALEAAFAALRAGETYLRTVSCQKSLPIVQGKGFCDNCVDADKSFWEGKDATYSQLLGVLDNTTALPGVYEQPRYIIEEFPGGESLSGYGGFCNQATRYYRITARGVGLSAKTDRIVQSIYRF